MDQVAELRPRTVGHSSVSKKYTPALEVREECHRQLKQANETRDSKSALSAPFRLGQLAKAANWSFTTLPLALSGKESTKQMLPGRLTVTSWPRQHW